MIRALLFLLVLVLCVWAWDAPLVEFVLGNKQPWVVGIVAGITLIRLYRWLEYGR